MHGRDDLVCFDWLSDATRVAASGRRLPLSRNENQRRSSPRTGYYLHQCFLRSRDKHRRCLPWYLISCDRRALNPCFMFPSNTAGHLAYRIQMPESSPTQQMSTNNSTGRGTQIICCIQRTRIISCQMEPASVVWLYIYSVTVWSESIHGSSSTFILFDIVYHASSCRAARAHFCWCCC